MDFILQNGVIPSPKDIRDYKLIRDNKDISAASYIIDNLKVKNQGSKPTCAAHALSTIIEYNYNKETGDYKMFSTDFIYGLRDNSAYKTEGLILRDGLSIIKKYGDVFYLTLSSNSYANEAAAKVEQNLEQFINEAYSYRITSYYKVSSIEDIKYSIMYNGPVIGAMKWYKGSKLINGILKFDTSKSYYGHAVLLIGWNKDGFIVQNSWGRFWGHNGLFIVRYKDLNILFYEFYGTTDNIQSLKQPNKIVKTVAPAINSIISKIKNLKN